MSQLQELVDFSALTDWMDEQQLGSGKLQNARQLTGGTQNILLHFERANRSYVLRRPPLNKRANQGDNSDKTMRREAQILAALAGSEVPHPGLIAACDDADVIGAAFYLMEPVDGFNATVGLPELHKNSASVRHEMGLSIVDGIAALGRVDYQAVGLGDFGNPEGFLERQVPRWLKQLKSYQQLNGYDDCELPEVDRLAVWIESNCPADFTPGILHGDCHLANVMFSHNTGKLAALVDWELSTIGDPLLDLGWLLATWPDANNPGEMVTAVQPWAGFPDEAELVSHYAQQSSRSLRAINWYVVLACFKLAIILEGSYARAKSGKLDKATGDFLHHSAMGLFRRAHRRI